MTAVYDRLRREVRHAEGWPIRELVMATDGDLDFLFRTHARIVRDVREDERRALAQAAGRTSGRDARTEAGL